jgi:hypothetical protein
MKYFFILILILSQLSSNILCRKKLAKELVLIDGGYPSWIIDEKHTLSFVPHLLKLKDANVTKRNPLIGLSLITHKTPIKNREPILLRKIKTPYRFAMDDETYTAGFVAKEQVGLEFAQFSESVEDNLMIISGCCVTAGISIGGIKFLDSDYIKYFIESDETHFADVGARFIEKDGSIFVNKVNPFFTENPFLEGDQILYIDGEVPQNLAIFLKNILFSPKDRVIQFEILRNNELKEFSVETAILRGGGLLSDTFLENIGVWFDENLYVANVHKGSAFAKRGLRNSYRLMSINGKDTLSEDDVRDYLSSLKMNMPDKFKFIFRHKDKGDLEIELRSNKKFFKNIDSSSGFGDFSFGNSMGSSIASSLGTGNFNFGGNFNGDFLDDTNESFYDLYNAIPLAEYLSY